MGICLKKRHKKILKIQETDHSTIRDKIEAITINILELMVVL